MLISIGFSELCNSELLSVISVQYGKLTPAEISDISSHGLGRIFFHFYSAETKKNLSDILTHDHNFLLIF